MNRAHGPLVVMGVGNVLLRDDGAGVRVVEALRRLAELDPDVLPRDTRLLDGGTLGLGLLPYLEGARAVVIVDAVDLGHAPGTVTVLEGDAATAIGGRRGGSGSGGLEMLLATAGMLGRLPASVAVVGIQVGEIGVDLALSRDVAAALERAVETTRRTAFALDAMAVVGRSPWPRGAGGPAGATA